MFWGLTTSDWLGIAGMVIAIVGFGVTLLQLQRVKKAVKRQAARTAGAMALIAIGQLERIEVDLRLAVAAQDDGAARRALTDWRGAAAELQAIARFMTTESEDLVNELAISLGLVPTALADIGAPGRQLPLVVAPCLAAASNVCAYGKAYSATLTLEGSE